MRSASRLESRVSPKARAGKGRPTSRRRSRLSGSCAVRPSTSTRQPYAGPWPCLPPEGPTVRSRELRPTLPGGERCCVRARLSGRRACEGCARGQARLSTRPPRGCRLPMKGDVSRSRRTRSLRTSRSLDYRILGSRFARAKRAPIRHGSRQALIVLTARLRPLRYALSLSSRRTGAGQATHAGASSGSAATATVVPAIPPRGGHRLPSVVVIARPGGCISSRKRPGPTQRPRREAAGRQRRPRGRRSGMPSIRQA
jgi:hypothetical protein